MARVKNKKIIRTLSGKILSARKKKNLVSVMAIALTAILFTTIFTIGGSIIQSNTESTLRQVGSRAHAGFKQFTWEEYEKLKEDSKIRDLSYNIIVGFTANPELNKIQGEVRYFEEQNAKDSFSFPTTGTYPEKIDDIAMSTIVLDALGVPHKLGEKVELDIRIHDEVVSHTFYLCGFWEGDKALHAQEILVSRQYCDQVAPLETIPVYEKGESQDLSGYMDVNFSFDSSFNIDKQVKELIERCGFEEDKVDYGVNWAYGFSTIDSTTLILLLVVLGVIMLSGYLIIYNIFYLNIFSDIRFYGLLKTIGTTGKQLRKLVRRQAWTLCIYGLPVGLLAGWVTGRCLAPAVLSMLTNEVKSYSVSPWIFIGAAIFTIVTVYISCIKPCRMASRVSPVEAVKYTEKQKAGKRKHTKRATSYQMALANVRRNPKKLLLVVLSLSLSLVLLNSVYTIVTGFDMDKYLANYIVSDYAVSDASVGNFSSQDVELEGVTKEFQQELKQQDGVKNIGNVYIQMQRHEVSEQEWNILEGFKEKYPDVFAESSTAQSFKEIEETRHQYTDIYGVDEVTAEKINMEKGELDWEKFKTGKYVIVNTYNPYEDVHSYNPYLNPGDTITFESKDKEKITYEVLAVGELAYALQSQRYFSRLPAAYILPESEFITQFGEKQPMRTIFDAEKGKETEVTEWLRNYCENVNSDLEGKTKEDYVSTFQNLKRVYTLTGGFLSFILALIGILNFINVTTTSVLARRKELAMLESIGMTGKQQKKMLQFEGLYYAALTLLLTCTIGVAVGYFLVKAISGQMEIFTWHFTLLPVLLCTPVILIISIIVPVLSYKSACRSTVVERLRFAED